MLLCALSLLRIEGNGVNKASCTQQESQPWLEIDLGRTAVIETVIVWNRTDTPQDKNLPFDYYTSRLFPVFNTNLVISFHAQLHVSLHSFG